MRKHPFKEYISWALIAMIFGFSSGFIFTPVSLEQIALAFTNNYTKNTGDQLTAQEWENLPLDFLDKTAADTKVGNLTMNGGNLSMSGGSINMTGGGNITTGGGSVTTGGGGISTGGGTVDMVNGTITGLADPVNNTDAVNLQSITTAINNLDLMRLISAGQARIVCGQTIPGATPWEQYRNNVLRVLTVDTSAAGFNSGDTVHYITNLSGGYTYATNGGSTVYNYDHDSFRFYALYVGDNLDGQISGGGTVTPAFAATYNWAIHWCAVGPR